MTLVLVLLLAGCAAGQGDAGRTLSEETTANGTEETTVYKEETTVLVGAEGRTIPVELPAGEYVVDVFITVQQGDATYYFRIVVE